MREVGKARYCSKLKRTVSAATPCLIPEKYRTKEEVEDYKKQDPIEQVLATLKKKKWITEAEIEAIDERIKTVVEESVRFSEESPYPDASELYRDVYVQEDYPYIIEN